MLRKWIKYVRSSYWKTGLLGVWMRSIALVAGASVVSILLSLLFSLMIFKGNADRSYSMLLDQIGVSMDAEIYDAQKSLLRFLSDSNAVRMIHAPRLSAPSVTPYKMDLIDRMASYCTLNGFVDQILLYFPSQDYLISSETLGSTAVSHYAAFRDYMPDYDQWHAFFFDRASGELFVMPTIKRTPDTGNSNVLYYVQTLGGSPEEIKAYFSVEGNSLTERIGSMTSDSAASAAVLLSDGSVFVSSDYRSWEGMTDDRVRQALQTADGGVVRIPMRRGTLFARRSRHIDIWFALFVPGRIGGYANLPLTVAAAVSILATLLFGALLVLRQTDETFSPLLEIRSLLKSDDLRSEDSELTQIRDAISQSREQIRNISSELNVNNAKLQASYLQMLLLGSAPELRTGEMLADLHFEQDAFAVMLFSLADGEYPLAQDTQAAVFLVLQYDGLSQTMRGAQIHLRYALLNDVFVMAANLDRDGGDAWEAMADEAAHRVLAQWEEKFDAQLVYAYSGVHTGPAGLSGSYSEALVTLRYKLVHQQDPFDASQKLSDTLPYYYPAGESGRLVNLLQNGTWEEVDRCIDELWMENERSPFRDILLECLSDHVAGTLLNLGRTVDVSVEEERTFFMRLAYMQRLNTQDRKPVLKQLAQFIFQKCHTRKEDDQQELYKAVLRYVREHFSDPLLSVDSICAHFGRSHNYIYTAVKNASGEGILYLINTVRLDQAKALLRGGMTVEKAAKEVGLNSALALFRIFKRYEGITPGKYIEQARKNRN